MISPKKNTCKPKKETSSKPLIQKFTGNFEDVDGGVTIKHTRSCQLLNKVDNAAIYDYLISKPSDWIVNAKEVASHYGIGIKRVYAAFSDLILIGLMRKDEIREKGKFVKHVYYLYLEPRG